MGFNNLFKYLKLCTLEKKSWEINDLIIHFRKQEIQHQIEASIFKRQNAKDTNSKEWKKEKVYANILKIKLK